MLRTITMVSICSLAGCSLSMRGAPRNQLVHEMLRCDTGKGRVFADGLLAATAGVTGIAVMGDSTAAGLGLLAVGGLAALSAAHGNRAADSCERAIENQHMFLSQLPRREAPVMDENVAPSPAAVRPPVPVLQLPPRVQPEGPGGQHGGPATRGPDDPDPAEAPTGRHDRDRGARPSAPADGAWDEFWELVP